MNKKELGQFFTPQNIVELMLDHIDYHGENILFKKICDNSAGEGAFLTEIVKRIIKEAKNKNIPNIENILNKNVFGIELEEKTYQKLISRLNQIVIDEGLDKNKVNWDNIKNDNALKTNIKVDLIIGNPPYVRKRNLIDQKEIQKYSFSNQSNGDLYLSFFEKSLESLNEKGEILYLTPSSWFSSKSAEKMREYFYKNNLIEGVIDFEHQQIFNATTYVAITHLKKDKDNEKIHCYEYKENKFRKLDNHYFKNIQGKYYLVAADDIEFLTNILLTNVSGKLVKNGFATLADNIFFQKHFNFESEYIIDAIKSSTGDNYKAIFPYKIKNNATVEKIEYKELDGKLRGYLEQNKNILLKRSLQQNTKWYEYGRSQAINDIYKNKISLNTLTKNGDLKIIEANNLGVFSGLYILCESENTKKQIIKNLRSNSFFRYIKLLRKYKSGGYYSFSSQDVEKFLIWSNK